MYETLVDYNDRNDAPFSNEKIWKAIHKVISEEETDSHNVTVYTFYQMPVTPNTQGENENTILISEGLNNLDALAEILKRLTINDTGYYESKSANENDAKETLQAIRR